MSQSKLKFSCSFCNKPTNFKSTIIGMIHQPYCIDCYAKLEEAKKPNIINTPAPAPYKLPSIGTPQILPTPYRPYVITGGKTKGLNDYTPNTMMFSFVKGERLAKTTAAH